MLNILSLGAGVQSSTLALMAEHGEIDRFDAAIFSDTGWEPKAVYDWLEWLKDRLTFPVYVVSNGNLRDALVEGSTGEKKQFASVPYFTESGGMGRRQCTNEHKIVPVRRKVRELAGLKPRQRAKGVIARIAIGISMDEAHRAKPSQDWYIEHY